MFVIIQMCCHSNLLFAVFMQLHLDSHQFAISDCEEPIPFMLAMIMPLGGFLVFFNLNKNKNNQTCKLILATHIGVNRRGRKIHGWKRVKELNEKIVTSEKAPGFPYIKYCVLTLLEEGNSRARAV